MKNPSRKSAFILAVLSLVGIAGLMAVHAQQIGTSSPSQPSTGDSIVALAADSQSLSQVAPTAVPLRSGTYWWVYPGGLAVPTPMLPLDVNAPIYSITPQEYLVDLTGGTVFVPRNQLRNGTTTITYAAAVAAQVQGLIDIINLVQTPTPTPITSSGMTLNTKPMGGGFSPMDQISSGEYPYLTINPTNSGELLITVINTNSATYYLQMTPVLGDSNYPFAIIQNGTAGQSNFLVDIGPYSTGFFRALMTTNNPGAGIAVFIDSPANGATVQ